MAIIYRKDRVSGPDRKKQTILLAVIIMTLWVLLSTAPDGIGRHPLAILLTVAGTGLFFYIVALGQTPLNLFRRRPGPKTGPGPADAVVSNLSQLDDHTHIFCGITLEFFFIDFLVLCPRGIFVITLSRASGRDNADRLNRETAKLWQRCHMIRMLIQKGYGKEVMPVPMLALQDAGPFEHNDVTVLCPEHIPSFIGQPSHRLELSPEEIRGFSTFLAQRYLR